VRSPAVVGASGRDRGSLSLEAVLLMPVVTAFFLFAFAAGIREQDQGTFDLAVQAAARAASLDRNPGDAVNAATAAADTVLQSEKLQCSNLQVAPPVLRTGTYDNYLTVSARCDLSLDLGLPFPITTTVTSDFASVVDSHRGQG
jgi:Flp pilus assembly protein TadG